jgi:hypothetical protein
MMIKQSNLPINGIEIDNVRTRIQLIFIICITYLAKWGHPLCLEATSSSFSCLPISVASSTLDKIDLHLHACFGDDVLGDVGPAVEHVVITKESGKTDDNKNDQLHFKN